ncbi:hypothetical protein AB0M95_35535 [Sphaerisporangium sp. NPDC051017]|uniref:hypothetical protein n=1 Tax=Sphaerisporangium sp. NPDC051017 TaxID=3154636 RepID=UPI00343F1887
MHALDLDDSPLLLHRYAHGLTAAQVVAAFNDLDPAGSASMRTARLYDLEGWPQGRRRPSPRVLDLLARIYQTTARRLVTDETYSTYGAHDRELIDAADYRHLDPFQRVRLTAATPEISHVSMEPTAGAWPVRTSVATSGVRPEACAALFRALTAEEADVKRRELLFELAVALGGVPALRLLRHLTSDEEARLAQAVQGTSRVDAQTVTAVEKLIAQCWQIEQTYGPAKLLPVADAQRGVIAGLLSRESLTPALRDRLVVAYSGLSHLGGWLCYDLVDYVGAVRRYEEGVEAAYEVREPGIIAHLHGCLAHVASSQGKPAKALDHAYAAQAWAKQSSSRLQQAAIAHPLARALAGSGKGEEGIRVLDRACELASAPRTEADPSHLAWCTPEVTHYNIGYCLAALKRSDEALRAGEQALTGMGRSFPKTRGRALVVQATALIQKREIQAATQRLGEAAQIIAEHSSLRLGHSVRTARQQLQPWATNTYVRALDEKLRALGVPA